MNNTSQKNHPQQQQQKKTYNLFTAYVSMWKNIFNFGGRANRGEFWWAMLAHYVLSLTYSMSITFISKNYEIHSIIADLVPKLFITVSFIPLISLSTRRLHDASKRAFSGVIFHICYNFLFLASFYFLELYTSNISEKTTTIQFAIIVLSLMFITVCTAVIMLVFTVISIINWIKPTVHESNLYVE